MLNVRQSRHSLRLLSVLLGAQLFAASAWGFDFNDVSKRAKALASAPYVAPDKNLPASLKKLNYDQYRDIRFRAEKSLWRKEGLPFEAQFFHRGGFFQEGVKVHEINGATVREIRFDTASFHYGANKLDGAGLSQLGFAGFRLHYPLNNPAYKDELVSFLGASYFRALGADQAYGLSARGLAVDTARSSGEEFPRFTEFWLERPLRNAKQMTLYALLDSPRLTGAYRFVFTPGKETAVDVKSRVFLRDKVDPVAMVGIAPLTSMFLFGENQPNHGSDKHVDYRPEVHDSDGLSISAANGEWIWRPLQNPKRLLVTSFALKSPRGFGLMQRDRKFDHYEDLEAHYERRPSVWIQPRGDWGSGRVELVQIPVPDETNDNIVAYWVSDVPFAPGAPRDFEYRLLWQKQEGTQMQIQAQKQKPSPAAARTPMPPLAWVAQSRLGRGYVQEPDDSIGFHIDFEGPLLATLKPEQAPTALVSADANGQIVESILQRNAVSQGYRLSLRVRRVDATKPVELRARLRTKDKKESELWSHILPAE